MTGGVCQWDGGDFTRGTPRSRRCFCHMRYRITAAPTDKRVPEGNERIIKTGEMPR